MSYHCINKSVTLAFSVNITELFRNFHPPKLIKISDISTIFNPFSFQPTTLMYNTKIKVMTKENLKRAGITVAVVVAGAVAIKLLPMAVTLSGIVGFVGGVVCSYLWRTKTQS